MCLYNYNNKIQTNDIINNEEYDLLSRIYQSIAINDTETARYLTAQLISLQSSKESITILNDAINKLN